MQWLFFIAIIHPVHRSHFHLWKVESVFLANKYLRRLQVNFLFIKYKNNKKFSQIFKISHLKVINEKFIKKSNLRNIESNPVRP